MKRKEKRMLDRKYADTRIVRKSDKEKVILPSYVFTIVERKPDGNHMWGYLPICPRCESPIEHNNPQYKYCSTCGQRIFSGEFNIREVMTAFQLENIGARQMENKND